MRILLVEDDKKLGYMLQYKLGKERNIVDWAKNADEAEDYFNIGTYDIYNIRLDDAWEKRSAALQRTEKETRFDSHSNAYGER